MTVVLTGDDLTVADVVACARDGERVSVADGARERVATSRAALEDRIEADERIYGVNTGFGALADERVAGADLDDLQANLVRSHAFGVGEPADPDEVRAMLVVRLNSLLSGRSGVRPAVVDTLADVLNAGVYPYVPRKGSAGASGDLAPLAHAALCLTGEGDARLVGRGDEEGGRGGDAGDSRDDASAVGDDCTDRGDAGTAAGGRHDRDDADWRPAAEVLADAGVEPLTLRAKEGLALVNGTNFVTAVAALAVHDARTLLDAADVVGGMTVEALSGVADAFDPRVHDLRGQPGQVESARRVRELVDDSDLTQSAAASERVQDSYSLRCLAQIHGASRDQAAHVADVVGRELNAVTDNPLLVHEDGEPDAVVSGGNFHAQPVALAADALAAAVAELADVAERRVFRLTAGEEAGDLPEFLAGDRPGLHSGFMLPQVTAAALVSENKTLAHPDSVDSIPTSNNQEDHVSMGANAANHLRTVVENAFAVLGIELFAAYQALSLRDGEPSDAAAEVVGMLDERIDPVAEDRYMRPDLDEVVALLESGAVGEVV